MQIPPQFQLSIATLIIISILCFIIAVFLIIKYIRQDPRTHDTLYFISAMVVFGVRFILQVLWYTFNIPLVNQTINLFVTILIIVGTFLLTTFFFSIYFKENPQRFHIILGVTIAIAATICILLALGIFQQALYADPITGLPAVGEYRYDFGLDLVLISFAYLLPATGINFGLFLYISYKKYEGKLRLKSVLMAVGLIIWMIAELLGPYTVYYIMDMGALVVILIGFVLKKE